jgi:hypothetical protein
MAERALDRRAVIAALARSEHGNLAGYIPVGLDAARREPEFLAQLVAWNHGRGTVRDAKVALPVLALTSLLAGDHAPLTLDAKEAFADNALAHLADLGPRELLRAVEFARTLKVDRIMRRLVVRYLRDLEARCSTGRRCGRSTRGCT